jgi:hypothetical protein
MKDDERGQRSEAEKLYSCAIDVALQTVSNVPQQVCSCCLLSHQILSNYCVYVALSIYFDQNFYGQEFVIDIPSQEKFS